MNLIFTTGISARNELAEMSKVPNWLISHTTSGPAIGQVDDSIIGSAELTRSYVRMTKYHAMLLFQNCTTLPSFADVGKDGITGRECVSKLLELTPINFTRVPEYYKEDMTPWMKYDPTEIKTIIDQGQVVQGVLDKKSIGKGAKGGIFHLIANEYSNEAAIDTMFNMQQLAIAHVLHSGFTVGIMDTIITAGAQAKIDQKSSDMINKSRLITERLNNGEIIPPIGKTVEEFFEEQQINVLSVYDDFVEPIMESIDVANNNLFKLIVFGSKGKMENLFNMVSCGGQKLINGERIRQKFGYKRTLPFFPRFDTSPEARGYVANSYLVGMNSSEYVFNAMAARFDLISKALTTASAGYQTRKSVLILQSLVTNNFMWTVKGGGSILQFAYGEDYLDPRKIESVKFHTVMISEAAMRERYFHKSFPEFFAVMQKDREDYRARFLRIEQMNVKELMTDDRGVAVNVERTVQDAVRDNQEYLKEPDDEALKEMVNMVTNFCNNLPYVFMNEIQERKKVPLPDFLRSAAWLMQMLVRTHLHPNALIKLKMITPVLQIILDKIRLRYSQAIIEPGTAVGIIAAQSFSEPLTQYMLDAHHRSASGGTSNNVIGQVTDILSVKSVDSLVNPSMLIPVLPEYESNRAKVQEIANNIEVMRFHQFVVSWQIFYEKFGEPVHSQYKQEADMIRKYMELNPLLTPPSDLTRWCIRFSLNKTTMILKNMSMELIISKLRMIFPDTFIVYTGENSSRLVIRIYMKNSMFKNVVNLTQVNYIRENILNTIIRGVEGILNATVIKMIRSKVNPDGSISRNDNCWGISTDGTNLAGVLCNRYVDRMRVHSSAIPEMCAVFGLEAGRYKIIPGMRGIVQTSYRHYLCYADEMSYAGTLSGIELGGLKKRDASNVLLRMGFANSFATIKEAAINSMEDTAGGLAQFLIGSVPKYGTMYNSCAVNEDFVRANVKRPEDIIAEGLL
jgi:DNA-directed RNA polymerase beta' subunit